MLEAYDNQQSGSTGAWEQGPECPWFESPTRAGQSAKGVSWVCRLRVTASDSAETDGQNHKIQVISSLAGWLCNDSR